MILTIPTTRGSYSVYAMAIDYVTAGEGGKFILHMRGGAVVPIAEATISLPQFLRQWGDVLRAAHGS